MVRYTHDVTANHRRNDSGYKNPDTNQTMYFKFVAWTRIYNQSCSTQCTSWTGEHSMISSLIPTGNIKDVLSIHILCCCDKYICGCGVMHLTFQACSLWNCKVTSVNCGSVNVSTSNRPLFLSPASFPGG